MSVKLLENYISKSQCTKYLTYILENGTSDISEAPEGSSLEFASTAELIGAAIKSAREFHVERHLGRKLQLISHALVKNSNTIDVPEGCTAIGFTYLTKLGRDYEGSEDNWTDFSIAPAYGDVVWFNVEELESYSPGEVSTGTSYKIVTFWK